MRDFCTSEKQVESCAAERNLLNWILEIVSFSSERFRDIIVSSSIFVLSGSKRVESIFTDRNNNLERKVDGQASKIQLAFWEHHRRRHDAARVLQSTQPFI